MTAADGDQPAPERMRRLQREVQRLTHEVRVAGQQTPMLRAMIEGCPDALVLTSLGGEVLEHNESFAALLQGGGRQDSQQGGALHTGRAIRDCLQTPGSDAATAIAALLTPERLQRCAASPSTLVGSFGDELVEVRLSGFSGGHEPVLVMSIRILDSASAQGRELSRTRVKLQSLGLQLEQQRQVDEAARLESLAMLAGSLAHDLNNALAIVSGNLELLQSSVREGPDAELLDDIGVGARQVQELVHRLHSFSGGANLLRQRLALGVWLPPFARSVANGHNAAIEVDAPDDPLWVEADEGFLSRVVLNLMVNAVQAAHSAGRSPVLKVLLYKQGHQNLALPAVRAAKDTSRPSAIMVIEDNGCGIPADAFGQLFVPFHTTKEAGTGLGLAGAARIVEMHGGAIGAENVASGGARFTVTLPLAEEAGAAASAATPQLEGMRLDGVDVLLMDDEAKVRLVMERALTVVGADVTSFESGEQILEAYAAARAEGRRPICILDMVVAKGMGGLETARQLRKKWPDARLLACTGHANVDLGKDHGELGFDGWLAKPFTVKALSDAVQSVAAGDDDAPA